MSRSFVLSRSLLNHRYVPLRKIASGSMGEIYLARQSGVEGFQREVVLKRIHQQHNKTQAVKMFLDEARLAVALCHPNIVQIFDIREDDGSYFIVMERIQGISLRELMETLTQQGQMISMELSLNIIAQVLEALRYAHTFQDETGQSRHVVHGDIRPSKILVSHQGAVKLAGFGLARTSEPTEIQSGPIWGKSSYMSPEMIYGEVADLRSDLFSVGVLLYELTVGQRLYREPSSEQVGQAIPPPTSSRVGYPVDLEIIVMKTLEDNPDDRYHSAEKLLEDLEDFSYNNGLRKSRLRLGRFVCNTMGITQYRSLAMDYSEDSSPREEPTADELDFDRDVLFDDEIEPRKNRAGDEDYQSKGVMEVLELANRAIAELEAEDEEENKFVADARQGDDPGREVGWVRDRSTKPELDRDERPDDSSDLLEAVAEISRHLDQHLGSKITDPTGDELERIDQSGPRQPDDLELVDQQDLPLGAQKAIEVPNIIFGNMIPLSLSPMSWKRMEERPLARMCHNRPRKRERQRKRTQRGGGRQGRWRKINRAIFKADRLRRKRLRNDR